LSGDSKADAIIEKYDQQIQVSNKRKAQYLEDVKLTLKLLSYYILFYY